MVFVMGKKLFLFFFFFCICIDHFYLLCNISYFLVIKFKLGTDLTHMDAYYNVF